MFFADQFEVRHGWVITKDLISGGEDEGVMGPRNTPFDRATIESKGVRFRMLDDDGEVYYEGRFFMTDDEQDPEAEFAPMEDYGMPNAGCTSIQYWKSGKGGGWQTL